MTRVTPGTVIALDDRDRAIVNRLQDGIPMTLRPYAAVASELGCVEYDLRDRIARLLECGVLTRFGPFFDAKAFGGAFCLCAMAVPEAHFDRVSQQVNAHVQVAHNYERVHTLNMWFVLATETPDEIMATARAIEDETGVAVLMFPKLEEFFIGFKVAA